MINNIRVGIPIIGGKGWLGGISYIELLAKAVNLLPKNEQPQLFLVVTDWTLEDFQLHQHLVPLFDSIIYVGQNIANASKKIGQDFIHCLFDFQLTEKIDFYFPVIYDVLNYICSASWIPDFQHRYFPELFSSADRAWRDIQFNKIASQSHCIVFSSHDAQKDFLQLYPECKVTTKILSFHAIPQEEWYTVKTLEVQKKYHLPDKFILCCNQFWTHKNHRMLFEAIALLHKAGQNVHLVCTSSTHDHRSPNYYKELQRYIIEHGISQFVHILGLIPREDQIQLIRRSLFVVQPSLFEGWSTVVEDCRVLGKSIILSDLNVHLEQSPKYGIYFKRTDVNDLLEKINKLLPISQPGPDLIREEEAKNKAPVLVEKYARQFCDIALTCLSTWKKTNY